MGTASHVLSPAPAQGGKYGQLADLELRHRQRARCEDRIHCAKDTGLRNLPLHTAAQNQVWLELVALASELTAWTQLLALDGPARRWNPNDCACACSPPPDVWSKAADAFSYALQPMEIGRPDHHRDHPPAQPARTVTTPNRPNQNGRRPPRDRGTPPPARQLGHHHGHLPKNKGRPGRQAAQPTSRKIEVNGRAIGRKLDRA